MAMILNDLLNEARRRRETATALDTLKIYRLVLEGAPLDFDLRLEIGDLYAAKKQTKFASAVYNAVVQHDIKAGNPLRAIVALKLLQESQINITPLLNALMEKYSAESKVTGRSIKLAPTDYTKPLREDINLDYEVERDSFILETAQMAADTRAIQNYPNLVPPVPIFSTLQTNAFGELLSRLILRRYPAGAPVVTEGDPGEALFFIARGEVDVVKKQEGRDDLQLARLGPGSLFGEMALLSDEPRSASVVCNTAVDALELPRKDVEEVSAKMPQVAQAMSRFMSERMILNLLATNPLFAPFKDEQKRQLLSRFKGHDVPAGTIFLEEGDAGRGLYVILQGHAEVIKKTDGEEIKVAELKTGDVAGEMSLIEEAPVSATVRTTSPATLLFLARELFLPLMEAVPRLKDYFKRLSRQRAVDTQTMVEAAAKAPFEVDEEIEAEEVMDLSDDDMVLI